MARAREEARNLPGRVLRLGAAALQAFFRTGHFTLESTSTDDPPHAGLCRARHLQSLRRGRLAPGYARRRDLQIHIAEEEGALGRLKAGADVLAGAWRNNKGIHSFSAQRVRIGSVRRRTWAATDGELRRERMPLDFAIEPRALTVLSPEARGSS